MKPGWESYWQLCGMCGKIKSFDPKQPEWACDECREIHGQTRPQPPETTLCQIVTNTYAKNMTSKL